MSVRWAVGPLSTWVPEERDWQEALCLLLPDEERAKALRFVHAVDRHRTVIGRLLILRLLSALSGVRPSLVPLRRTRAGKPYVVRGRGCTVPPGLGFNVSHHGEYVILAADAECLVGCDVMSVEVPGRDPSVPAFFRDMERYFTPGEWALIRGPTKSSVGHAGDDEQEKQLSRFFCLWTLKESLIKATGVGLEFPLQSAEFRVAGEEGRDGDEEDSAAGDILPAGKVALRLHGREAREWSFSLGWLDGRHVAAVGYGPHSAAIEPDGAVDARGAFWSDARGRLRRDRWEVLGPSLLLRELLAAEHGAAIPGALEPLRLWNEQYRQAFE